MRPLKSNLAVQDLVFYSTMLNLIENKILTNFCSRPLHRVVFPYQMSIFINSKLAQDVVLYNKM